MTALETGRHHRSPSAPSLPQLAQNAKVEKELQVGPDLRRTVSSRGPGVPRDCPDGAGRLDRDQNDSITTQPAIRQSLAHQLVPSQNPLHRSKSARLSPQTGATRPVPGKVTHWQVTKPSANSPPSASSRSPTFLPEHLHRLHPYRQRTAPTPERGPRSQFDAPAHELVGSTDQEITMVEGDR